MELRYPPPPSRRRAREKVHFAQQRFCGLTAGLTRCGFSQRDSVGKINMAESGIMVMMHIGVLIMYGIITMIYNHKNHGYDAYY